MDGFFLIQTDVKFEYGLRLQDPLLAVGIGLDFECGLAECAFDPRDHLGDAALAFHFCLERERLLHPLQRVILLAVAVQTEDKEFSLRTDPPLLRAEIDRALPDPARESRAIPACRTES